MTTTTPVERRSFTWGSLVRLAVAGDLVLLLAQGVARQDRDALAVAAAMLLGAGLLRLGGGLAGLGLLCLSFANLGLWMLPAAVSNAGHHGGLVAVLLPAAGSTHSPRLENDRHTTPSPASPPPRRSSPAPSSMAAATASASRSWRATPWASRSTRSPATARRTRLPQVNDRRSTGVVVVIARSLPRVACAF